MAQINSIFDRIENLTKTEGQCEFASILKYVIGSEELNLSRETFDSLQKFFEKITDAVDELAAIVKNNDTILISVKNQKLLRTCFELITSLGISPSLLPGLGIDLAKRSINAPKLPRLLFTDIQKYSMLTFCTDFFTRSYSVPVLKKIIMTLHLSDYLASLIQLCFTKFKKPGIYKDFVMTQEMFDKLCSDRAKYVKEYKHLTTNCFQPSLMKELMVLLSVQNPLPPSFASKIIANELSERLIASGGVLSLIRCLTEGDTECEWEKIDLIARLVATKHGNISNSVYLINICTQLKNVLCVNIMHNISISVGCILHLYENNPESEPVVDLLETIFEAFNYDFLMANFNLPCTLISSVPEVYHKVNVLHACVCTTKFDWPISLLIPNLYLIYMAGSKCTNNENFKTKLTDIIVTGLEKLKKEKLCDTLKELLFGKNHSSSSEMVAEQNGNGVIIKCVTPIENYAKDEALTYFLHLLKSVTDKNLILNIFEASLSILIELSSKRVKRANRDMLITEDDPELIDDTDQEYAVILQVLTELSTAKEIITSLRKNPLIVSDFIEHFIWKQDSSLSDEGTIALVLLNTILSNPVKSADIQRRFGKLVPKLKKMCSNTNFNTFLCEEAIALITSGNHQRTEVSACEQAISEIFDELLPVRAHGVQQLTKLIDQGDTETLSKNPYIFCILQEQLKHNDSYLYLAAINGLAALCSHSAEDVLHVLCREYLQMSHRQTDVETRHTQNENAEIRMKIGDVIVKVTKRLGEMAVVHKTVLLNTMLCACRDDDPLIRTSALSNLAEISLVLNYKMGTILHELLLCIGSIIETDKAPECRRAAVMVIANLIKGLGKETLVELKDYLLPVYRTLKRLYSDDNEDSAVKLHAQLALEELNDVVKQFLTPEIKMEKQILLE